jgi:hypothetical protein
MFARLALVLLALGLMPSARAADLLDAPLDCNCGSPMITIYDFEPGVVTRHWAECTCRRADEALGLSTSRPSLYVDRTPLIEPWRR